MEDATSLGIELSGLSTGQDGLLRTIEPVCSSAHGSEGTKTKGGSDSHRLSPSPGDAGPHVEKMSPLLTPSGIRGGICPIGTGWENEPPRSPSPEAEQKKLKHKHHYDTPLKMSYSQGSGSKTSYQTLQSASKEEGILPSGLPQWKVQMKEAHAQLNKRLHVRTSRCQSFYFYLRVIVVISRPSKRAMLVWPSLSTKKSVFTVITQNLYWVSPYPKCAWRAVR